MFVRINSEFLFFVFLFQGLEIVNPQAAETKNSGINSARYFSNTASFVNVHNKQ